MGTDSKIDWCLHTWNPWQGCHRVSEACLNCYMYRDKKRYGQNPDVVVRSKSTFKEPIRRDRQGNWKWRSGDMVFVCSWSDFFHADADQWRQEAWQVIQQRLDLVFFILTKRVGRITQCLPSNWGQGLSNVWLGVTAETQKRADERVPVLLEIPAVIHFVSCEPLLGPIDLTRYLTGSSEARINWVITGSESGPRRRMSRKEWFRSLRDQCLRTGTAYFLKQMEDNGKLVKMPTLDGERWEQYPNAVNYKGKKRSS